MEEASSTQIPIGSVGRCPACGCIGPNPGYQPLSLEEINENMKDLSTNWALTDDNKKLHFKFTCKNWQAAIDYINQASRIAESEQIQHHPDLHLTKYRDVEVVLHTHSAQGITNYDFKLAKALDKININFSPKFLRSNPHVQINE